MSIQLTANIGFDGRAAKAMAFYRSVFGGTIASDTFGEFDQKNPGAMPIQPSDADKVMFAQLSGDNGFTLMAADAPTGMKLDEGSRITLTLSGDDETLLHGYWDKLAEGADVSMPLSPSPWGDTFGMLTDKFGVAWMVNISKEQVT